MPRVSPSTGTSTGTSTSSPGSGPGSSLTTLHLALAPQCRTLDGRCMALATLDALLLAWLALQGATPRERLAELLWPGSDPSAARNALRQRLFRLRKQTGRDLVSGSVLLALTLEVTHDLDGAPTLLGALDASAFPELGGWLERHRLLRKNLSRQAREADIQLLEAAGDVTAALPLALALLDTEPLSEDAHRRVMRLHYLRGDRAAAVLAFDRCEALLKHEVGAVPSTETLALLQTIEAQALGRATHTNTHTDTHPRPPTPKSAIPVALLRPPRMINRHTEMQALRHSWAAGSVVVVSGEAGMGKSRLLHSLAAEVPGLVLAAGRPGDALVPYASFARLLLALAEHAPVAFDDATRQRLAPLLPSLAPAASILPKTGWQAMPQSMTEPVTELLSRAGEHVTGLVLDDAHFADGASLDLLESLLCAPRGDTPTRWCLGMRPPEPGSRLQGLLAALSTAAPFTLVTVQPLTTRDVAELVDSLQLAGVQGANLAPGLRQRCGGNPLFALETLKLAWSEGGLGSAAGLADSVGHQLPMPQSLSQLINLQLARLSSAALMLARLAAIAGVDFSLPLAIHVLGQNALQLADPWSELEKQQLLVGTDFAHDLIFEAVVAGLPDVIARHLHEQVAMFVQAAQGEPARIAAHWEAAGQRERALPALHAAAHRAHAALRERERINFLLRAADIAEVAGDLTQAFECVARAVDTHMNSIRQASGFSLLDRLDHLAQTPAQRCDALGQRAWYCMQLTNVDAAVQHGEQALALAHNLGTDEGGVRLQCVIRQRLATALGMAGRFDDALAHFEVLLADAAAWQPVLGKAEQAELHDNFAVVLDNLGRTDEASHQRNLAVADAAAGGDLAQQVSLLANHAVSRLTAGDVTQAQSHVEQAQRVITTYDMRGSTVGFCAVLQMQCARALGHYGQALQAADVAVAELQASNPARLPVVHLHLGHVWLDLGQFARAHQAFMAAGEGHQLPAHFEARRLLLQARLARAQGGDEASALLARAQATAPRTGWPEMALVVGCDIAATLTPGKALQLLARSSQEAQRLGLKGAWLLALSHQAMRSKTTGAALALQALQVLQLAQEVEPALGYRAELRWQMARVLAAAGQDERAAQVLADVRNWVRERAANTVPAPFVDSFLQRNAANRVLLGTGALK